MKKNSSLRFSYRVALLIASGVSLLSATAIAAPLSDEDVQALIHRVDELEQQVKSLKAERKQYGTADVNHPGNRDIKTNAPPVISLGANGLIVQSGNSNFTMIAHGYAQGDARFYVGDKTTPDTFLLRRVRPIVEGTIWQDFNYRLMLDVASGSVSGSSANNVGILDDAYVNSHFWKDFQIQIGKYKAPVGLERLQSTADLMFVETGFATELTPNYDLGVEIHNEFFNRPIGYSLGIFDGASDNASQDADVDEGKDIVGRVFTQPFLNVKDSPLQHLGFGVGGSIGTHTAGPITAYKTPGQQTFFAYTNAASAGTQYRIDPQAFYYWGPFGIMGEWAFSSQNFSSTKAGMPKYARFNNNAWQVEGSWFITGEENTFKASSLEHIIPHHRFGMGEGSGWGAFEVVARVQQMYLDQNAFQKYGANSFASTGSAQKATSWGVGLNWYLNGNMKLNLDYENTTFSGYTPTKGTGAYRPEHAILARAQVLF